MLISSSVWLWLSVEPFFLELDTWTGFPAWTWLCLVALALPRHHWTWPVNWLPGLILDLPYQHAFALWAGPGCHLWTCPSWLTWGHGAGHGVTLAPGLPYLGEKHLLSDSFFKHVCEWVSRGELLWPLLPKLQKMVTPVHSRKHSNWSHLFAWRRRSCL